MSTPDLMELARALLLTGVLMAIPALLASRVLGTTEQASQGS
jgi:hypothetical protein